MWMRCGRIRKKSLLIVILVVFSVFVVYFCILHFVNYILINTEIFRHAKSPKHRISEANVIVAHYVGTGNLFGNFSKDYLNENLFHPVPGEGENGRAVIIPARDILKMQRQFQINRFNLLASDRIQLNRTLPDVRKKQCTTQVYSQNLPRTSVIIVFYNEAWSVLLRTVWSVINRSPKHLIEEILLVDDASDREFLLKPLEDYVANLPIKTVILRQTKRLGLVSARLLGAEHSHGEVLTFLDAHCECTNGWLEPLLTRVKQNTKKVVCPVIDIISDDNFGYIKSFELHWGAFNWQLHFRWFLLGAKQLIQRKWNVTVPFPTPAMAGGLFAINKEYFYEIGGYDDKMKIWGGDNLEMSFRIWQCGGEIEIVPCSHVGHLFRKSSPYTFPGGVNEILNENLARTAMVWMDEWSTFFIKYYNLPATLIETLNVSDRLALRDQLKCKSFDWYLTNVWPEHFFPTKTRFFGKLIMIDSSSEAYYNYLNNLNDFDLTRSTDWSYLIRFFNERIDNFKNMFSKTKCFCLQKPQNQGILSIPYGQTSLKLCGNESHVDELFVIKPDGHIMTNEGICLDGSEKSSEDSSLARLVTCAEINRQKWTYHVRTQQLVQNVSTLCLSGAPKLENEFQTDVLAVSDSSFNVTLTPCSDSKLQKWIFLPLLWR